MEPVNKKRYAGHDSIYLRQPELSGSQRHKTAVDGAGEQEISKWEFQFGKMRRSGDSGGDGHTRTRSHNTTGRYG